MRQPDTLSQGYQLPTVTAVTCVSISDIGSQRHHLRLQLRERNHLPTDIANDPLVQNKGAHCT